MLKHSHVDAGRPLVIDTSEVAISDLDDSQLTDFARGGNAEAFGALFERHRQVSLRLARHLAPRSEADDIVAEAFARVFAQMRKGGGPTTQFRSYVLTTVRHESGRRAKARKRVLPTDDVNQIDSVVAFDDRVSDAFEDETVRRAFDSLPNRWREVLWHLDVQGAKPQDLAAQFSLTANGVSALGYRARNGLREAYVQAHARDASSDGSDLCQAARPLLAGFVRGRLSRRDSRHLEEHLDGCAFCAGAHAEVAEVNKTVAAVSGTGVLGLAGGWMAKPLMGAKSLIAAAAAPVAASVVAAGLISVPMLVTPQPATAEAVVAPQQLPIDPVREPVQPKPPKQQTPVEAAPAAPAAAPPAVEEASDEAPAARIDVAAVDVAVSGPNVELTLGTPATAAVTLTVPRVSTVLKGAEPGQTPELGITLTLGASQENSD